MRYLPPNYAPVALCALSPLARQRVHGVCDTRQAVAAKQDLRNGRRRARAVEDLSRTRNRHFGFFLSFFLFLLLYTGSNISVPILSLGATFITSIKHNYNKNVIRKK